jgi:hypothetical protein
MLKEAKQGHRRLLPETEKLYSETRNIFNETCSRTIHMFIRMGQ